MRSRHYSVPEAKDEFFTRLNSAENPLEGNPDSGVYDSAAAVSSFAGLPVQYPSVHGSAVPCPSHHGSSVPGLPVPGRPVHGSSVHDHGPSGPSGPSGPPG